VSVPIQWPDPEHELARLKGFQRDTAEYAFRRLYLDEDGTRRFLVADEVGLGKTLVARGILALAVDHLRRQGNVDRIDVVYICSNAEIARQNMNRLAIQGLPPAATADRLTLLPRVLGDLEAAKFHFLALSVGTSLDMGHSMGQARERAVLYHMLDAAWDLGHRTAPMNFFQGWVADPAAFRQRLQNERENIRPDNPAVAGFTAAIAAEDRRRKQRGEPPLRIEFDDVVSRFKRSDKHASKDDRRAQRDLLGTLRKVLARACVQALKPDLVIVDEFQRFRHLLREDNDAGLLAKELFDYEEGHARSRVLLLSATPYKMYTLRHEVAEEDHYADFIRTFDFLETDLGRREALRAGLTAYRKALVAVPEKGPAPLAEARDRVATSLRRVMCRTERVRETGARDAMLREVPATGVALTASDVRAYRGLAGLATLLDAARVVEYWKSAPNLISFFEGYQLDQKLRLRAAKGLDTDLARALRQPGLQLDLPAVRQYGAVDAGNPRVRALLGDLDRASALDILWVPPSAPDYELEDAYRQAADADFTKRLIFSNWRVVPRAVASLVSYEVERRIAERAGLRENTPDARRRRTPLLTFRRDGSRNATMSLVALLYPSFVLAEAGAQALDDAHGRPLSEVLDAARRRIAEQFDFVRSEFTTHAGEDPAWYWAAPILLDRFRAPETSSRFWELEGLADTVASDEADVATSDPDESGSADGSSWSEHLSEARELALGRRRLGAPPAGVLDHLAALAVAGPAVCTLRALVRACPGGSTRNNGIRVSAARAAWGLRGLFNRPEAMDLIRSNANADEDSYARLVLDHAARGGLTSVVEEHVHLLRELIGVIDFPPEAAAAKIADAFRAALQTRTGTIAARATAAGQADEVNFEEASLRTHYAAPFGQARGKEESDGVRADAVRAAFNSPFWPFVLVSTSVGQEGLDFHPWCHAVVHWNLPSNPVDLEQREGRVHRFKGHAVRKNVARRFASSPAPAPDNHPPSLPPDHTTPDAASAAAATEPPPAPQGLSAHADCRPHLLGGDRWSRWFTAAASTAGVDPRGGLTPYWLYPGPSMIERHVPALPFSRESTTIVDLRRTLAVYRMVFGQPRQDDLVAYLQQHLAAADLVAVAEAGLIDLRPGGAATSI
jgi:hypothetical protein